ncbi:MAG: YbaK/EbsC family protein [Candidatus Bathyarchaeia archaeon]
MLESKLEELIKKLNGEIINVGKNVKTVEQAVNATGLTPKQIIKSLLYISEKEPLLVIVDGESKVDLNKLTNLVGLVRLAKPREVREIIGYDVGGVPPVGIKVRTIVDSKVLENDFIVGGGGSANKLLKIDPKKVIEYQKAEVTNISVPK